MAYGLTPQPLELSDWLERPRWGGVSCPICLEGVVARRNGEPDECDECAWCPDEHEPGCLMVSGGPCWCA